MTENTKQGLSSKEWRRQNAWKVCSIYVQLMLLADAKKNLEYQPQNSMVFGVAILFSIIIIIVGFVVIAIVVVSRYDVLDIVH